MKKSLPALCFVFAFSLLWAASLVADPQPEKAPDGEAVYKTNCTRCHNTPPSLTERQTRVVVSHMRVRANLTERDAKAVMHYLAENARSN
jgi:mono/diheme cytochrome c family protein